jgi:hypothetical protein
MSHIIGRGRYARETYPKPAKAGGGSTGCQAAVVFSPDPPCTPTTTIRSDRSADQSPITGTPVGATNLGSDTTGATTGVSGSYATVSGGDQNVASADFATVSGGAENEASGEFSTVPGGVLNFALAELAYAGGGEESVSAGQASVSLGTECAAANLGSVAIGLGAGALGDAAVALSTCEATGDGSFAVGGGNSENKAGTGGFSFSIAAGGVTVTITGDATASFLIGGGVTILPINPKFAAAANRTVATNPVFAAGDTTFDLDSAIDSTTTGGRIADTNIGADSVAVGGIGNQTLGDSSSIVGGQSNLTAATATSSRAGGKLASTTLVTQDAWSSGSDGATPGNIQTNQLVLAGTTPGNGAGETVELTIDPFGDNAPMQLDDNKGYTFRLSIIAQGVIGGVRARQSFEVEVTCGQDAGAVTVDSANIVTQQGSAAAASWTVSVTAGVGPARLVVTFSTGATTAKTVVGAQTRYTEAFLSLA